MNDVTALRQSYANIRRQRSIYRVHYGLQKRRDEMPKPWPHQHTAGRLQVSAYDSQVAGHRGGDQDEYLGLLQCNNGTVLKPLLKESQQREVDFYTRLQSAKEVDLVELAKFVPKYFGRRRFAYCGRERDYIVLEDLAHGMMEPCIMDVKIGKRTWDPLASEAKISREQSKYSACKQQFGFCVPGYQVYRLATGQLLKYGKEYGKRLHGNAVKDAIKNYLNGVGTNLCRALILQFLSELWKIQKWCSKQTSIRIYSSSLLLIYDARRLRDCCGENEVLTAKPKCVPAANTARRKSIHSMHSVEPCGSFSGQLSSNGPVYRKVNSVPLSSITMAQQTFSPTTPANSTWIDALQKVNNLHSSENNYEDTLSKIKMNYRAILDQLSNDDVTENPWGCVKIIDFAHAFFNDTEDEMKVDDNFKEGIDNFVAIFEALLKETDDQVF